MRTKLAPRYNPTLHGSSPTPGGAAVGELLHMLFVDVGDDLLERLRRDLGREALDLLEDKVREDEVVHGLQLKVDAVGPVPEVGLAHARGICHTETSFLSNLAFWVEVPRAYLKSPPLTIASIFPA